MSVFNYVIGHLVRFCPSIVKHNVCQHLEAFHYTLYL